MAADKYGLAKATGVVRLRQWKKTIGRPSSSRPRRTELDRRVAADRGVGETLAGRSVETLRPLPSVETPDLEIGTPRGFRQTSSCLSAGSLTTASRRRGPSMGLHSTIRSRYPFRPSLTEPATLPARVLSAGRQTVSSIPSGPERSSPDFRPPKSLGESIVRKSPRLRNR